MVTCYEAGAFGVHLHRRLEELGIKNYVVQPQDWDERGIWMNDNCGTHGLDLCNAGMRGCKATARPGGSRAMSF